MSKMFTIWPFGEEVCSPIGPGHRYNFSSQMTGAIHKRVLVWGAYVFVLRVKVREQFYNPSYHLEKYSFVGCPEKLSFTFLFIEVILGTDDSVFIQLVFYPQLHFSYEMFIYSPSLCSNPHTSIHLPKGSVHNGEWLLMCS